MSDLSTSLQIYKERLQDDHMQHAYYYLMDILSKIRSELSNKYKTGSTSFGYLDYSYFPYQSKFLEELGLKFGVVLNHKKMQLEVWLMGRNKDVQTKWYKAFLDSDYPMELAMPKYYILSFLVCESITDDIKTICQTVYTQTIQISEEVENYIKDRNTKW